MIERTMIRTSLPTSRHPRLTGCAKQRNQRAVQADDGRGVDLSLIMTGYSVPDVHPQKHLAVHALHRLPDARMVSTMLYVCMQGVMPPQVACSIIHRR